MTYRKVQVHCRVAFELFDAAQQLLAELDAVEMLRDGGNMADGFNVFWVRQSAPGVLDINTAD